MDTVFLGALQTLLGYFQKDRQHRDVQKDEALRSLSTAVNATLRYEEESGGSKGFDREREFELAALWNDAAIRIRHISRGLSQRLGEKAEYWADKLEWAPSEVADRKIRLVEIKEELRNLLRDA